MKHLDWVDFVLISMIIGLALSGIFEWDKTFYTVLGILLFIKAYPFIRQLFL